MKVKKWNPVEIDNYLTQYRKTFQENHRFRQGTQKTIGFLELLTKALFFKQERYNISLCINDIYPY